MRAVGMVAAILLAGVLGASREAAAQAPAAQPAEQPKVTWYFYTVKWGFQNEFLDLFRRNHYPVLKAQQDAGRFLSVKTYVPEFHGDGRADWTFAVELVEAPNPPAGPGEQEIIARLYPDRATFDREEQRRFELLVAHWDVPLNLADMTPRR